MSFPRTEWLPQSTSKILQPFSPTVKALDSALGHDVILREPKDLLDLHKILRKLRMAGILKSEIFTHLEYSVIWNASPTEE